MDDLIEPYDGPTSSSRNATERSELAEQLVIAFLRHRALAAAVNWEKSGHALKALYKSLWRVCRKRPYRGRVRVIARAGKLILIRKEIGNGSSDPAAR